MRWKVEVAVKTTSSNRPWQQTPAPMTTHALSKLRASAAALGARLALAQLVVSRLDLQPYLNQARSIPWSGLAMVVGSSLQRLVS